MATKENIEVLEERQLVSSLPNTVQILRGSVFVSYGDEPTLDAQGHILNFDAIGKESLTNGNTIDTWVRATRTHKRSMITVTEGA